MRKILFDPAQLTAEDDKAWWEDWLKEATDARDEVLSAWQAWLESDPDTRPPFKPQLKQTIWKDLKRWLLEHVFHERCAYCESPLEFDRYLGDAEHFRPKGAVTSRDKASRSKKKARCRLPDGREIDHPGYFWLAYDWRNLVPACSACNSGAGKVDQFPTSGPPQLQVDATALVGQAGALLPEFEIPKHSDKYFLQSDKLDEIEKPKLLNPLNPSAERDPARHLRYGVGGCVVAIDNSEIGSSSIDVYQLERGKLQHRRQKAQELLRKDYYSILMRSPGPERDAELTAVLDKYRNGQEDFSSAALDHLREDQRSQTPI